MVLVFQPGEEAYAGAKKMIEDGAIENVEAIFALHVRSDLPLGQVSSRSGSVLAGCGVFKATINGKGGHAAIPHHSVDPILAASNVIVSLQHLVSREADPLDSQVSFFFFLQYFSFFLLHLFWVKFLNWFSSSGQ